MDGTHPSPVRRPLGATGLRTIELLAGRPAGIGLREIAREIGLDPGQAHRLMRMLDDDGWVIQDETKGRYRITGRLLAVAGKLLRMLDLRDVAGPVLHRLQRETAETVGLVELRGDSLVLIDRVLSDQALSVGTQIGDQIPFETSASGRAVRAALLRSGMARGTHAEPDEAVLDAVERGYSVDNQVYRPDVLAVAAAILNLEEQPIGAIFVAAPAARTSMERTHAMGALAASAASEISRALGSYSASESADGRQRV